MNRVDSINRGLREVKPLDSIKIRSLEGKVSEEEWAIRVDLAAAYRMVAHYGWDDLIFTHLSARIPGPENYFLLNPYNLMFEEVTASSLVKVRDRQPGRADAVHQTEGPSARSKLRELGGHRFLQLRLLVEHRRVVLSA